MKIGGFILTEFNDLLKMLEVPNQEIVIENGPASDIVFPKSEQQEEQFQILPDVLTQNFEPFNIDTFTKELYDRSANKNQLYRDSTQNISAYDISSGCIREVVYKLLNTPVESFADKWLPILLRSTLGSAVHEFIQNNTNQFTEREVSLKLPSIRFSIRLDNLIGPNILVEIKSCPYSDYEKIIKTRKPRVADFYQAMSYKYALENHLQEAKDPKIKIRKGSSKPRYDKYDIQKIQFIYVAHDITTTDVDSFSEVLERIKQLKRLLNSKSNSFFFITTLVVNLTNEISKQYLEYVENKIKYINYYVDNNKLPESSDPFVDKSKCYFCLYSPMCDLK